VPVRIKVRKQSFSVVNPKRKPVTSITINLYQNLIVEAVLSTFWLLYKQAIQVSTMTPEARCPDVGFRAAWKIFYRRPCLSSPILDLKRLVQTVAPRFKQCHSIGCVAVVD